jgi:hypothetical protein
MPKKPKAQMVRRRLFFGFLVLSIHSDFGFRVSGLVGGRKAVAVDGTGLTELDAARVDLARVLLGAVNARGDAWKRGQSGGGDGGVA